MSAGKALIEQPTVRSGPGLLRTLRAHVVLVVAATLLGGLVGYGVSLMLPTSYTASASVIFSVDQPFDAAGERSGDPVRFTADQVEIATTDAVLVNASVRVIPPIPLDEIRTSVKAEGSQTTNRMTVTAERPEPEQARALADAIVAGYREEAQKRVDAILAESQDVIDDDFLEGQMRVRAAVYGDGVATVEPAQLPTTPSAPLPLQNALIGAVVGLLGAVGVALLRARRRARNATVADLDMLVGAPLITRFASPESSTIDNTDVLDPSPARLQTAHDVLAAIDVALEDRRDRSVLFLSWQRPLATTSLVVSVGLAMARAKRSVVLIDGGLKDRGISALTNVKPGVGLNALADHTTPFNAAVRTWSAGDVSVGVVPLDSSSPSATGAAARPQVLRNATQRLQQIASLTLVDGPPLTDRSLGLVLGRGIGGVVLVIDEQTSIDDAHEMGRRVELAGVHVIGYVLANVPRRGIGRAWRRSPEQRASARPAPVTASPVSSR